MNDNPIPITPSAYTFTFSDAGKISRYAIPERVLQVQQIDKTSVGKINKRVLREKYGAPVPVPAAVPVRA
jgi:acyl-CoA synthetase (AMP-forming)/AMP-acid ligase II